MPPFHPFGPAHLGALAVVALATAMVVVLGRRLGERGQKLLADGLALSLLGYVIAAYLRKGLTVGWHWGDTLPLQVCDWTLIACLIALVGRQPLAFEIAYFWGLTGAVQALLTPDLHVGFPSLRFFQFFWGHGGIVAAIACLAGVLRFRPRPRAVPRMFVAINAYALIVGSLDAFFGWNYGYLAHTPSQPSLLDHLGPWPWYILSMEAVALLSFIVLDLPWKIRRKAV